MFHQNLSFDTVSFAGPRKVRTFDKFYDFYQQYYSLVLATMEGTMITMCHTFQYRIVLKVFRLFVKKNQTMAYDLGTSMYDARTVSMFDSFEVLFTIQCFRYIWPLFHCS